MYNVRGAKIDGLIIANELSWGLRLWEMGGGVTAIKMGGGVTAIKKEERKTDNTYKLREPLRVPPFW